MNTCVLVAAGSLHLPSVHNVQTLQICFSAILFTGILYFSGSLEAGTDRASYFLYLDSIFPIETVRSNLLVPQGLSVLCLPTMGSVVEQFRADLSSWLVSLGAGKLSHEFFNLVNAIGSAKSKQVCITHNSLKVLTFGLLRPTPMLFHCETWTLASLSCRN